MGQSCCQQMGMDGKNYEAIRGLTDPEEYHNRLNIKNMKNRNTVIQPLDDFTIFKGQQLPGQPMLNQNVQTILDNRQTGNQIKKTLHQQPGLLYVRIQQKYYEKLQQDEEADFKNSSSIIDVIFQSNYTNKIEYRPVYFKFFKTGIIYQGEWKVIKGIHVPHGRGRSYFPNQAYYEGLFKQGMPHYYGLFVSAKGDCYEGQFKYGRANGKGYFCTYENGIQINKTQYRGSFKDNQKHGKGIQKSANHYFQGQFQYDEKVKGLLKYQNITYQGEFQNQLYHGKGILTIPDKGTSYDGQFKEGKQNGFGEYFWKDGSYYRGNFTDGRREGYGEYYNAKNQSTAKGMWKQGALHGNGQYINRNSEKVRCIWDHNKIAGMLN